MLTFFEDDEDDVVEEISEMGEMADDTCIDDGVDVLLAASLCLRRETLRHIELWVSDAPVNLMVSAMLRLGLLNNCMGHQRQLCRC